MTEIKNMGLFLCSVILLLCFLKQLIPSKGPSYIMKSVVSIFIAVSILIGLREFDFKQIATIIGSSEYCEDDVWKESERAVGDGLKKEYQHYLDTQQIDAVVEELVIRFDEQGVSVEKVLLSGKEADTAKNLLAGRYQIGLRYIEVKNE